MRLVFVSSTFKDMQFERDELKNRVAPRIDSFLATYGENVHFGDLRWGVNTTEMSEEESAKKVLKVCLDEIDDCRPYMIVFIGERYGWIPSQELIKEAASVRGIENIDSNISVTNLEIEYGALLNPDFEGHILFYFRNLDTSEMSEEEKKIYEAESNLHKEKLDSLKKAILEKYPSFVRNYDAKYDKNTKTITNLSPLMEMVYNDLCHIFKIDLDKFENLPNYQRAIMNSETRFEKYSKNAYRRKGFNYSIGEWNILDDVFSNRYNTAPIFLDIDGDAGAGKKTCLATMYEDAKNDKAINSYPFVVGLDEYTKGVPELLEFMTRVLEVELGLESYDLSGFELDTKKLYLVQLIERHSNTDKYVRFFIMNCTKEVGDLLRYIDAVLDSHIIHISFYVTYEQETFMDDMPVPFYLFGETRHSLSLEEEDKLGIIKAILKSKHKELPESVINLIVTKEESDSALYLSLIIERLLLLDYQDFQNIRNMGDGMIAIENYMKEIVNNSGNSVHEISKELLKELKERINPNMIPICLRLLTYDYKLTNKEIEEFFMYESLNWDNVDYSLFIHSIPSLFKDSSLMSPYLEFKITEIKEAAKELVEEWGVKDCSEDIISFIETKIDEEIEKDKHLIEVYRGFNKPEKSAEHYLNILNKIDDNEVTDYEIQLFKKLEEEYQNYPTYYLKVSEIITSYLNNGKVNNVPQLSSYFYKFLDISLPNDEMKELWSKMVVETLGYIYEVYVKNKNQDVFFLLMVGFHYIDGYFSESLLFDNVDDGLPYYEPYLKADAFYKDDKNKKRYWKLTKQFKEKGFNDYYLNFYFIRRVAAELNHAIINNEISDYVEENEEDINERYEYFFVNEETVSRNILEEEEPDSDLFKEDEGVSLIVLAQKFVVELYNENYETAMEIFRDYSNVLMKYRDSFYFFKNNDKSNNIGSFLLSEVVVEFLTFVRVNVIADFPDELQDEFEEAFIGDLLILIPLLKLYLADHYEDAEMIARYLDILQSVLSFRPDEENANNIDMEEMAFNYLFTLGLYEWAIYRTNPTRLMVTNIFLKEKFIGYIYKNIEEMNSHFIHHLTAVYWLYMNKHEENDDDWYDSILYIIASYLISTKQEKNNKLIKRFYDEFYKDVYSESYKEFKESVNSELAEFEYQHAKTILELIGEEDDEN